MFFRLGASECHSLALGTVLLVVKINNLDNNVINVNTFVGDSKIVITDYEEGYLTLQQDLNQLGRWITLLKYTKS